MTTQPRRTAARRPFILGIIPARAGSKRLPGKNIRRLAGKPLLAHIIATARRVRELDDLIVSTESPRIARVARRHGAAVPFLRPARYATDRATDYQVVTHAVRAYERLRGVTVGIVVMLHTTTPTTVAGDIRACLQRVLAGGHDSAITVFRVNDRPEWCGILTRAGRFRRYFTGPRIRRMARVPFHMPSGGVYVARWSAYVRHRTFFTPRCGYLVIPPERNTDIDTLRDLQFAEFLMRRTQRARRRR